MDSVSSLCAIPHFLKAISKRNAVSRAFALILDSTSTTTDDIVALYQWPTTTTTQRQETDQSQQAELRKYLRSIIDKIQSDSEESFLLIDNFYVFVKQRPLEKRQHIVLWETTTTTTVEGDSNHNALKIASQIIAKIIKPETPVTPICQLDEAILDDIVLKFEKIRKKTTGYYTTIIDGYDPVALKNRFRRFTENNQPILFVLPAFPFKSSNERLKVIQNKLPDMAEYVALENLHNFLLSVRESYPPGARLCIVSDGRVYCDCFKIPDETTTAYQKAVKNMYPSEFIDWIGLDCFMETVEHQQKRTRLTTLFPFSIEEVEKKIKADCDFREVYLGFKRFLKVELETTLEGLSVKQSWKECGKVAKIMMQRNYAYGKFVKSFLSQNHVRLSIHPSSNTKKIGINLFPNQDYNCWGTPWHNCALKLCNGEWKLERKENINFKKFKFQQIPLPHYEEIP